MIYFVQGTRSGLIKIGYSLAIKGRLQTLQIGSPERLELLAVLDGTTEDERDLHQRFAAHRSHGEWFHPRPELLSLIRTAQRKQSPTPENHALARRNRHRAERSRDTDRQRLDVIQLAADAAGLSTHDWLRTKLPQIAALAADEMSSSDPATLARVGPAKAEARNRTSTPGL